MAQGKVAHAVAHAERLKPLNLRLATSCAVAGVPDSVLPIEASNVVVLEDVGHKPDPLAHPEVGFLFVVGRGRVVGKKTRSASLSPMLTSLLPLTPQGYRRLGLARRQNQAAGGRRKRTSDAGRY